MPEVTFQDWAGFYTAQIGAAAALAGLLFVGLSLNLTKILAYPALPNRALLALGILLAILVISSLVLIPGQSVGLLGFEILAIGVLFTIAGLSIELHTLRHLTAQNRPTFAINLVFLIAAVVPYVIGGAVMVAGSFIGLYWVAAAIVISFVKAIADAWVLLVEINR